MRKPKPRTTAAPEYGRVEQLQARVEELEEELARISHSSHADGELDADMMRFMESVV